MTQKKVTLQLDFTKKPEEMHMAFAVGNVKAGDHEFEIAASGNMLRIGAVHIDITPIIAEAVGWQCEHKVSPA